MTNEHITALMRQLEGQSDKTAQQILSDAISEKSSGAKLFALTVIRNSPETALALLEYPVQLGLSEKRAADALDAVVGEIESQEEARKLMAENLTPVRLRKLLAGRGDLPSSAAMVASLEDIIATIEQEATTIGGLEVTASLLLLGWALKLKDRQDYRKFLEMKLFDFPVYELITIAVWNNAGRPRNLGEVTPDMFVRFGIDPFEGKKILRRCLKTGEWLQMETELLQSKARLAARQRIQRQKEEKDRHLGGEEPSNESKKDELEI